MQLSPEITKKYKLLNSHCYIDPKFSEEDLLLFEKIILIQKFN